MALRPIVFDVCFCFSFPFISQPLNRQSHGQIIGYEVTVWSREENVQHTHTFPPDAAAAAIDFTQIVTSSNDTKVTATVIAKNNEGSSQPASMVFRLTGV